MRDVLVVLDASASSDPDESLLHFRFDPGDGSPPLISGTGVSHHLYHRAGLFSVCVVVTDGEGLSSRACQRLEVLDAISDGGVDARLDGGPDARRDAREDAPRDARRDLPEDGTRAESGPDQSATDGPKDQAAPDAGPADLGQDAGLDGLPLDMSMDLPVDTFAPDVPPDLGPGDALPLDGAADQGAADGGMCFAPEVGGSGASGYTLKTLPSCGLDLQGTGNALGLNGDNQGLMVLFPFTFHFMGKPYNGAGISANGYLQFPGSNPILLGVATPAAIPAAADPNNLVAALWDDLAPLPGVVTDVLVQRVGLAPQRVYVIQWQRWTFAGRASPAELVFSVLLYESSNVIELQYLKLDGGARATGGQAAVGIEDETGTKGWSHLYRQPVLSTGTAIRFVPN